MGSVYLERLQIPEGFETQLQSLIKEILREQPEDIITYCHQYFLAMQNHLPPPKSGSQNQFGLQREEEISRERNNMESENPILERPSSTLKLPNSKTDDIADRENLPPTNGVTIKEYQPESSAKNSRSDLKAASNPEPAVAAQSEGLAAGSSSHSIRNQVVGSMRIASEMREPQSMNSMSELKSIHPNETQVEPKISSMTVFRPDNHNFALHQTQPNILGDEVTPKKAEPVIEKVALNSDEVRKLGSEYYQTLNVGAEGLLGPSACSLPGENSSVMAYFESRKEIEHSAGAGLEAQTPSKIMTSEELASKEKGKTPKDLRSPKTVESQKVAETPKIARSHQTIESHKEVISPKMTESPKAHEDSKETESHKDLKSHKAFEKSKEAISQKESVSPKDVKSPHAAGTPKDAKTPKETESPKAAESHKEVKTPKQVESPKDAKSPKPDGSSKATEAHHKEVNDERIEKPLSGEIEDSERKPNLSEVEESRGEEMDLGEEAISRGELSKNEDNDDQSEKPRQGAESFVSSEMQASDVQSVDTHGHSHFKNGGSGEDGPGESPLGQGPRPSTGSSNRGSRPSLKAVEPRSKASLKSDTSGGAKKENFKIKAKTKSKASLASEGSIPRIGSKFINELQSEAVEEIDE